jgi:hypothetical protein
MSITKLSFSTLLATTGPGSSLPADDDLRRSCEAAARATEKIARERREMNFGSRIAAAVKRRLAPQARAAVSAEGDSFGEQLKKAVEKRSGKKQREQQAERERDRYPKRRKRTKSE